EVKQYEKSLRCLSALVELHPESGHAVRARIEDLIQPRSLGDLNTIYDLQHYVTGPSADGLAVDSNGHLDEARSFRFVDYFTLLASQRSRNNPQARVGGEPVDFVAATLPLNEIREKIHTTDDLIEAIWLERDDERQLIELVSKTGTDEIDIRLIPASHLQQDRSGKLTWKDRDWSSGLPFKLFEDPNLAIPEG